MSVMYIHAVLRSKQKSAEKTVQMLNNDLFKAQITFSIQMVQFEYGQTCILEYDQTCILEYDQTYIHLEYGQICFILRIVQLVNES